MSKEIKTTGQFNKTDWSQVIREAEWNSDYQQTAFKFYLGTDSYDDILITEQYLSLAKGLIIRFILTDFLKEKGFSIRKTTQIGYEGEYAPSFSNIEYNAKQTKSCINRGGYLVERDSLIFYVSTDPTHDQMCLIRAVSLRDKSYTSQQLMQDLLEYAEQHNFLKGGKISADCSFIKFDKVYTWDDLILSDRLKEVVRKNLSNITSNRDIYKANNRVVKRGLIFSGAPGSGKSTLGKILCHEVKDWTFVWVTPKFLERASNVTAIVELARELSPTILFLEDLDLYGADRESNFDKTLLGELMNQLDGIQENKDIISIATTNKEEILEKALLDRPGRFDKVIPFSKPTKRIRLQMLELFLKGLLLDSDVDLDILASEGTDGMTGAHIREVANLAFIHAIDDKSYNNDKIVTLKNSHFLSAIDEAKKKDISKLGFGVTKASKAIAYDPYDD